MRKTKNDYTQQIISHIYSFSFILPLSSQWLLFVFTVISSPASPPTAHALARTRARYRNWSVLSVGEPQGALLFCSHNFVLLLFPAPTPTPLVLFVLFSKPETRKDEMEEEWEGLCSRPELIFKGYTEMDRTNSTFQIQS